MITRNLSCAIGAIVLALAVPAAAQDLVYEPVNPNFGGNPFNSAHLLAIANAQNDFEAPRDDDDGLGTSQADLFVRQLQSRLLSGLAGEVTEAIFGDNPQETGTIQFGSQTITFERGLTSIRIVIFDSDTGTTTEIEIPILDTGDDSGQGGVPGQVGTGASALALNGVGTPSTATSGALSPSGIPASRPVIAGFTPIGPHPTGIIEIPK